MKSLRDQILTKCVHFNGIQHDSCKAGVAYESMPRPLPCFADEGLASACTQAKFMTPAEADEKAAQMTRELNERLSRVERGRCLHCDAEVAKYVQAGHCAYAEPCGHRMGQANAAELNKALSRAKEESRG